MKKLLLFIFFTVNLAAFSQINKNEVDSILKIVATTKVDSVKIKSLLKLEYVYRFIDFKIALDYAAQALKIAETKVWEKGLCLCYNNIGGNYLDRGEHPKALEMYNNSLKYSQEFPIIRLRALMNISNIYLRESNLPLSLQYIEQALKIATEMNDSEEMAYCFYQLGLINRGLNNLQESKLYYQKSLKIFREKNNLFQIAELTNFLGEITTDYKEKLNLLAESKSIWDSIAPEYQSAVNNAIMLSKTYLDLYKNDSLKLVSGIDRSSLQLLNEAEILLYKAIDYSKISDMKQYLMDSYETLAEIEKIKKNHEKAYNYLNQFLLLKDSIYSQKNKNKIAALESTKEIQLRDNQIKINKWTLENKEKQKWFFIAAIILLGIIGGLLFYQSSSRKTTNNKLNALNIELDLANKSKLTILGILNHDLRSPVTSLVHYLQMTKDHPEMLDENTKIRIENATHNSAKNLLNSMEEILLWTKNQMDNFEPKFKLIDINSIFTDIKNYFFDEKNIEIIYENINNVEIFTDEDFLKTIVRNLTGNAISALGKKENPIITWKWYQINNHKYLSITDNGEGATDDNFKALFDEEHSIGVRSGLGLHLVRDLAKAINCKIEVETNLNVGTTIRLDFLHDSIR